MSAASDNGLLSIHIEPALTKGMAIAALTELVNGTPKISGRIPMLVGADGLCVALTGCGVLGTEHANRIAAAWGVAVGVPTADLEQLGAGGLVALTGLTEQYRQERDQLMAEMKFVIRFHDRLTGSDVSRLKGLLDRMLDLQQPSIPPEAVAIGAQLDPESLEQGEV